MRIREYLDQATALISDPAKAHEVRRELQVHLEEAVAEAMGQGLDAASAELVAVGRMGSPEELSVQLAVTHHAHLPWRLYLSPVPVMGLILLYGFMPGKWNPWVYRIVWVMLLFSLAPSRPALWRWLRLVYIDMVAKYQWIKRQPMRGPFISGGVGGFTAGVAFSLIPAVGRLLYTGGWYERFVPPVLWPTLGRLSWLLLFYPVVPGLLAVAVARRFIKGDFLLTGGFAAMAFPLGSWPGLFGLSPGVDPIIWVFFSVVFAMTSLCAGWIWRSSQRRALSRGQ